MLAPSGSMPSESVKDRSICSETRKRLWVFTLVVLSAVSTVRAGWIEQRDGKTIIHVSVYGLPNPGRTDTATRADVAAVRTFKKRFSQIFAEKYRTKYQADPDRYGHYDWDRVEIDLEQFSGIQVEGVENDLLAIAGGLAPDVLYVNFRKSDNYIQNGFLYPLDKPEDGYLSDMTREQIDFRVHPKIWPVIRRKGPGGQTHVWALPYGGALGKVLLYRKTCSIRMASPIPRVHGRGMICSRQRASSRIPGAGLPA